MKPVIYTVTENDILAGNDLWRRDRIKIWSLPMVMMFAWLTIYCAMRLVEIPITSRSISLGAVGGPILVIVSYFIAKSRSGKTALRYFRQSKAIQQEHTLDWTDTHLSIMQAASHQTQPWADFRGWAENDQVIALLSAGPIFTPLPKRVLTQPQIDDIRACLARANVPRSVLFPI